MIFGIRLPLLNKDATFLIFKTVLCVTAVIYLLHTQCHSNSIKCTCTYNVCILKKILYVITFSGIILINVNHNQLKLPYLKLINGEEMAC